VWRMRMAAGSVRSTPDICLPLPLPPHEPLLRSQWHSHTHRSNVSPV
jgi:hypothetical protein